MELKHPPSSFAEIKQFYGEVFRPLYDRFMDTGAVAQEIHAEMAMALHHPDHSPRNGSTLPIAE